MRNARRCHVDVGCIKVTIRKETLLSRVAVSDPASVVVLLLALLLSLKCGDEGVAEKHRQSSGVKAGDNEHPSDSRTCEGRPSHGSVATAGLV